MKKDKISSSKVIDNISKHFDKALFYYDEKVDFEEVYLKLKNNNKFIPYVLKTSFNLFLFILISYFLIFTNSFKFNIYNLIILLVIYLVICVFVILNNKKAWKKISSLNIKVYFYETFLIVVTKNSIEKIPYNEIKKITSGSVSYLIISSNIFFAIEKNKISEEFNKFLENLTNQYKSIKLSDDSNESWNCLHKYTDKPKVYCINEININTLLMYQKTKDKVYKRSLIILFICFIINMVAVPYIFDSKNFFEYLTNVFVFTIIITLLCTLLCNSNAFLKEQQNNNNNKIRKSINKGTERLYFYDDFMLIKNDSEILGWNYNKIKQILETKELFIIEIKSRKRFQRPIIIIKNNISVEDYKFLSNLKSNLNTKKYK